MQSNLNPQRVIRTGDVVEYRGKRYRVHYVVEKNGQTSLQSLLGKTKEILAVHDEVVVPLKPTEIKFVK
jgi:hypothetical protein